MKMMTKSVEPTPGRRIKSLRVLHGIEQKALARAAGVGVTRMSALENDHNFGALKVGTLVRLCEQLKCTLDYLVNGAET